MAHVHFILQGKGGVGKSLVAALLAQYFWEKQAPLICIDTDPVNNTLSGYTGFDVQHIDILKDKKIDERKFDDLMQMITEHPESHIVIDNGASSFLPLSSYLFENQAIDLLHELGHKIIIHSVITGGQALMDTINGFNALAEQFSDTTDLVVWLNKYFGEIETDGKSFEDMKVYKNFRDSITAIITLPEQSELFKNDLCSMLEAKQTFTEAMQDNRFGFMNKNRLKIIKKHIFEQLDLNLETLVSPIENVKNAIGA